MGNAKVSSDSAQVEKTAGRLFIETNKSVLQTNALLRTIYHFERKTIRVFLFFLDLQFILAIESNRQTFNRHATHFLHLFIKN
jgi:hypothetical protein